MAGPLSSLILLLRPQKKDKPKVSRHGAHCGAPFPVIQGQESGQCPNCGRLWQKKDATSRKP
ncbi:hypothetical protein EDC27_1746 [Desulfosoma caldarium]|uniref:Uncharacterized protein n=1 Tax=Desulfosoma caldarium TaxID=610254 RepID=A0A3N1ULG8_9BACT|nr:hypothetical protein EDC27_1746 [Desulfosoma caldarium]